MGNAKLAVNLPMRFRIPHFALRTLDRYLLSEWLRVFLVTLLGFPILTIVIDLTDKLDQYMGRGIKPGAVALSRSEEHTSELQSRGHLVCRLLLEKKKKLKTQ